MSQNNRNCVDMKVTDYKRTTQSKYNYSWSYIYLIFLLVLVGQQSICAQMDKIDSLHAELSYENSDSDRLTLMDELINELISTDLKQASIYAQKALDLSRQMGDKSQEAQAVYNMGIILYETPERPSSLEYFEESEYIANELGITKLQISSLMSIAKYHRYVSRDSLQAVNHFLKSVEISKTIDYHWATGRAYAKLASFYTRYNQIDLSEKYLKLATEYYIKYPEGVKSIAHYYNEVGDKIWDINPSKSMDLYFKGWEHLHTPNLKVSIAKAYNYIGDNEMAMIYLQEAIPHFEETEKRRRMLGIAIAQLAEAYVELGNYNAANNACDKGLELLTNLGRSDRRAVPALYRVKGIVQEQKGNDKNALAYFMKSKDEAVRLKLAFEHIKAILAIGNFYSKRGNLQESKSLCKKAFKDAKKRHYTNLEIEACDCLYNIYKEEESYVDALNYHEQKIILTDSLSTMKVRHALDINDKIANKDKQLAEQSFQKAIRDKELKNQYTLNRLLLISILGGVLLIGFLTLGYRRIRRQNKEISQKTKELLKANLNLERSNEELERFAHITSHDLKTPIRNIVSFTGLLRLKLDKEASSDVNDLLNFIENGGKRMIQIITDVLEYSKLASDIRVEQEIINLNQLTDEISQLTKHTSDLKSVTFEISELPNLKWYHSKIFLLFKNIIENGIKYNKSNNPTIKIYCIKTAGINSIYIEDNGIGIEKEFFDQIFVMFNRLHTHQEYEGTGLGLATCKKIVDEFEGKINISSEINKGTTFKIEIPNRLIHQASDIDVKQIDREVVFINR